MNTYAENMYLYLKDKGYSQKYEHAGIYCIKINNRVVYIGKSMNMLRRISQHYVGIKLKLTKKYKILEQNLSVVESDYIYYLVKVQNIFYETVLEEFPQEFCYLIDELKNKTYDDYWRLLPPSKENDILAPRVVEIDLHGSIAEFSKKNPAIINLMETFGLEDNNVPF